MTHIEVRQATGIDRSKGAGGGPTRRLGRITAILLDGDTVDLSLPATAPPRTVHFVRAVVATLVALTSILGILDSQPANATVKPMLTTAPVAMTPTADGLGYWVTDRVGTVSDFGSAAYYGDLPDLHANVGNIVGITRTPTGRGYWLVGSDGGIFSFGDAQFHGSMGGKPLNRPVVGMASTPSGAGYWLVASDGGIFAFGDARFYGSTGSIVLNKPVVGMAPTPSGAGYWLVASDGGIFAFGDAKFYGSTANQVLNAPVVAFGPGPSGAGYWLVAADGGIFAFGSATFWGRPAVTSVPAPDLRTTVVQRAVAEFNRGITENPLGTDCNPYTAYWSKGSATGCATGYRKQAWCVDFAKYIWSQSGVNVNGIASYSGDFNTTTVKAVHPLVSTPQPGDIVVFGTQHVGIVISVQGTNSITMISGNFGNKVSRDTIDPTSKAALSRLGLPPVLGYSRLT